MTNLVISRFADFIASYSLIQCLLNSGGINRSPSSNVIEHLAGLLSSNRFDSRDILNFRLTSKTHCSIFLWLNIPKFINESSYVRINEQTVLSNICSAATS
ncbi:hypothetical protein pdam_00014749 [Pocillopora damicornis]|uniref:Uncharacterized protein n=1 Tax=Pocillopora damicornis TaxID=46731 RepID=A0A3M6T9Z5_POCDA|nr:hypothetical protein pdam_00014749 [Pocillopora damicornis]